MKMDLPENAECEQRAVKIICAEIIPGNYVWPIWLLVSIVVGGLAAQGILHFLDGALRITPRSTAQNDIGHLPRWFTGWIVGVIERLFFTTAIGLGGVGPCMSAMLIWILVKGADSSQHYQPYRRTGRSGWFGSTLEAETGLSRNSWQPNISRGGNRVRGADLRKWLQRDNFHTVAHVFAQINTDGLASRWPSRIFRSAFGPNAGSAPQRGRFISKRSMVRQYQSGLAIRPITSYRSVRMRDVAGSNSSSRTCTRLTRPTTNRFPPI